MIRKIAFFSACFTFAFVCCAAFAHAEQSDANYSSLFFTPDELRQIETEAQKKFGNKDPNIIHLGAIIFYTPERWAVWLQGERWTPETNYPQIHIIDVNSESVRLSITSETDGTQKEISLLPNQSYNIFTDKISEGEN